MKSVLRITHCDSYFAIGCRMRRAVRPIGVHIVTHSTILALLVCQTHAHEEIYRQLNARDKVSMSAGSMAYLSHAFWQVAKKIGKIAAPAVDRLTRGSSGSISTPYSPAGSPKPWEASLLAGAYSVMNMATGNLHTEVPIVAWAPLGRPVEFSLFHYNFTSAIGTSPAGYVEPLPTHWRPSYSRRFWYNDELNRYFLISDNGNIIRFDEDYPDSTTYSALPGYHMILWKNATTQRLTLYHKNWDWDEFDLAGRLLRLGDLSGNVTTLEYDTQNPWRLLKVTDASTNELAFEYDASGRLIKVVG